MRTTTDTLTILFTHSRRRIGFDFVHSRRLISHRLHKRAPTQKLTISLILFKSSEVSLKFLISRFHCDVWV
uniref:Uncharacterized protein n=1 Tax=Solanum tuberosum TaxID=4113 RepID=M1CJP3_SOLTU